MLKTEKVEEAMTYVDRFYYCPQEDVAYYDTPITIGSSQTISAPHMHACALEELIDFLNPGATIFDVGCGSGYLTACFAYLVGEEGRVYGIDIIPSLVQLSISNIRSGNPELLNRTIIQVGNGWDFSMFGKEEMFDAIHVGAAAEYLPESLVKLLKKGGRMVIPLGTHEQSFMRIDKDLSGTLHQTYLFGVRYVPLVKME